ncbi:hypothetical protein PVAP13_1NG397819 [Panicum virgatum]|uniref:Uncharacterized protein n=1 Tax=Panicum virgatum TaxID=38727 RepID=A0A8T0WYR3_PANVG|nr:hypothetical protein PVAP13_1NG397819 [Panicum virgatum]
MAAPEPEAKPEAETPSPSRELPPGSEPGAPAAAGSKELQPWEQHAAVINLPRYDYRASGSLLLRSHSGFLITCPIKREKSATKEAISILEVEALEIQVHLRPRRVKMLTGLQISHWLSYQEAVCSSLNSPVEAFMLLRCLQKYFILSNLGNSNLHNGVTAYFLFRKLVFYQKKTYMRLCQSYSLSSQGARITRMTL